MNYTISVERQLLYVQTSLDSLSEELTTEDITTHERSIDKELILLIQAACKSDNAARAIELTKLLHHLPSFDAAIKIAGFYHLVGLKEKLEALKAEREEAEDRLEVLRQKRRRWLKTTNVPREIAVPSHANGVNGRYDPLGDTRPPPAIERPGMSRVKMPIVERTRFSSTVPQPPLASVTANQEESQQSTTRSPSPAPWDSDPGTSANSPANATTHKRKRDEVDDAGVSQSSDVSAMPPPPKQSTSSLLLCPHRAHILISPAETNPFARKHNSDSTGTRNPFASRSKLSDATRTTNGGIGARGSIQKSDSFFEKVEAAESSTAGKKGKKSGFKSSKDKEKDASGTRQTTLFGMMPRAFQTSQAPKKPDNTKESRAGGGEDGDGVGEETQELLSSYQDMEDIEASDSQMALMDSRGLEETQADEETQMV